MYSANALSQNSLITNPSLPGSGINAPGMKGQAPRGENETDTISKVQGCIAKLSALDNTRTQWIQEIEKFGLSMCSCGETNRVVMENDFIRNTVSRFPPSPHFELSIMGLGAGGLLQDWILLKKLNEVGYRKVHLHFVDPHTTKQNVEAFKLLLKNTPSLSVEVSLEHSECFLESVPQGPRYHCIHAMDFERLTHPFDDLLGMRALVNASRRLKESGFVFCSAARNKYFFDAAVNEWDLSAKCSAVQCKPGAEVALACTNLGYFWQSTFHNVSTLVRMQARKIHIELIKLDEGKWVEENIPLIQQLCQEILSPAKQTLIDLTIQKTLQNNRYDIMILGDQFINNQVLDTHLPMVKQGGTLILRPDDCWKRIDIFRGNNILKDTLLKNDLQKKVNDTFDMMAAHAKALASSRSIDLQYDM